MTINTQTLADDLARDFGVSSSSSRFESKFLHALNRVLVDYQAFSEQALDVIEDLYTDIDLDTKYMNFVYSGLVKYLNDTGEWGISPKNDVDLEYRLALGMAQMFYLKELAPDVRLP